MNFFSINQFPLSNHKFSLLNKPFFIFVSQANQEYSKIMAKPKTYSITKTGKETLKKWYQLLALGRRLDEKAPNYLKQALGWSYHAPYAGHDGIQLAIGQIFEKEKDHLFPYYRDLLTTLSAGLTAEEIIFNGISKASDVASGGRHMSNHFAKPEWNIHNVSSATGNHTQHASGVRPGNQNLWQ